MHTPHTPSQDREQIDMPQQKESEGSYVDLVLSRIEQEGIKPHGRWYFILKNELLWGIGILTVLIGACAVSAALYNISHTEFELYQVTHDSALLFFYDMMPLVWIFGLLVFIGIGYIQIRHTKKGYKYPLYVLVGGMLLISIALGVMLHSIDIGRRTEEVFGRYIPFHKSGEMIRQDLWINAPKGIVAGEVVLVDAQMFAVKDFKGEQWLIGTEFLTPRDMFLVATGTKIRIVTLPLPQATTTLTGCIVMPWDMKAFHNQKKNNINDMKQVEKQVEKGKREDERKIAMARNNRCKDMHPYQLIEKIRAAQ